VNKLLLILLISFGFSGLANADKDSVLASECAQQLKYMSDFYVETGLNSQHADFDKIPQKINKVRFSSSYTLTGKSGNYLFDGVNNGYCEWFGNYKKDYDPLYQTNTNHKYTCHSRRINALKIELIGKNRFNEKTSGSFECAFIGGNYELDAIRGYFDVIKKNKTFIIGCESCRRTL
jgi:hypothetical protein